MKNIFLEISYIKCCEILFSDPIVKSQNWACFWINSIKVLYSLFLLYAKLTTTKMCSCRPLVLAYIKHFSITKRSETSLPACLSTWYLKKHISLIILYYLTKFCLVTGLSSYEVYTFLIFLNFLRSSALSRSATRAATKHSIYHVYK